MVKGTWTYKERYPTSLFIRDRLLEVGEDYPYRMWQILRMKREETGLPCGSLRTFLVTIWNLKKLGLIEQCRDEPAEYPGKKRHYYRIVNNKKNDKAWINPRKALYPNSYVEYKTK